MTEAAIQLALNGAGGVGLALLVHWHLVQLRAEVDRIGAHVTVLLDRVRRDGDPS